MCPEYPAFPHQAGLIQPFHFALKPPARRPTVFANAKRNTTAPVPEQYPQPTEEAHFRSYPDKKPASCRSTQDTLHLSGVCDQRRTQHHRQLAFFQPLFLISAPLAFHSQTAHITIVGIEETRPLIELNGRAPAANPSQRIIKRLRQLCPDQRVCGGRRRKHPPIRLRQPSGTTRQWRVTLCPDRELNAPGRSSAYGTPDSARRNLPAMRLEKLASNTDWRIKANWRKASAMPSRASKRMNPVSRIFPP